eukprot:Lankesteria_metandrocarpae@DN4201_c0_g1_i1.p1
MGTRLWLLVVTLFASLLRGTRCIRPVFYDVNGVTEVAPIFTLTETTTLCEHHITIEDINNDRCTKEDPCVAAINRWDRRDECGTCYRLVYHQEATTNQHCDKNACGGLKKELYIKIIEFYGFTPEVMFAVYQQGYSNMCPFACRKTSLCVEDPKECASGVYPEEEMATTHSEVSSVMVPGSTLSGRKVVSWEKVACGTTDPVSIPK